MCFIYIMEKTCYNKIKGELYNYLAKWLLNCYLYATVVTPSKYKKRGKEFKEIEGKIFPLAFKLLEYVTGGGNCSFIQVGLSNLTCTTVLTPSLRETDEISHTKLK